MNWEEVGAIGQVLGSVAVFITLGYLAVQLRHARAEVRRSVSQGRTEALRGLIFHRNDERISDIYTKATIKLGGPIPPFQSALMEQTGLTREDAFVLQNVQYAWWAYRVQVIPNVDELPAMERTMFDGAMRAAYEQPGPGRVFYETFIKVNAHPDAVRYIDNLLAQPN
mgnify:CR=1 FL=1